MKVRKTLTRECQATMDQFNQFQKNMIEDYALWLKDKVVSIASKYSDSSIMLLRFGKFFDDLFKLQKTSTQYDDFKIQADELLFELRYFIWRGKY